MAAGLGFKTFATGEVFTAADTNGYLMQGVLVFASAATRDAAITAPQEGQACYLKDTNAVMTYSGSTWVAVGGGSSPLTTKGDLYTFSTVDARLPVGTNGQVLTADSSEATGLKFATPVDNGKVLQVVAATHATLASSSSSTYQDTGLTATITPTSATSKVLVLVSQAGVSKNSSTTFVGIRLFRGASQIAQMEGQAGRTDDSAFNVVGSSISLLDTPATTSALTYKTTFNSGSATVGVSVQQDSARSSIVLLEIGA